MNLQTVFDNHSGKFSGKWKHYFDVYDRYLQKYIGQEFTLFEIGISNGGSLQIWKKYFGNKVRIIGVDIDPKTMYYEPQIETYCGSQSDPQFLLDTIKKVGRPDVIIDDGSHVQMDVLTSLNVLFPELKDDGIYIIEDTHTAYWHEWQGGINSPLNVVSFLSRLAHDVNIQHINQPYTYSLNGLKSLSFYDSMIVLEKELPIVKKEPCFAGTEKVV